MGQNVIRKILWVISALILAMTFAFGTICIMKNEYVFGGMILGFSLLIGILIFFNLRLDAKEEVGTKAYPFQSDVRMFFSNEGEETEGRIFLSPSSFALLKDGGTTFQSFGRDAVRFRGEEDGKLVFMLPSSVLLSVSFPKTLTKRAFLTYYKGRSSK